MLLKSVITTVIVYALTWDLEVGKIARRLEFAKVIKLGRVPV